MKARVLFVCTGNSARSQMAEGLARALASRGVEVASAGTHPAGVSSLAIEAMRERGIDIRNQRSKSVDQLTGEFDYVITLCDSAAQSCPNLPARCRRLHWSLPDPGTGSGTDAEKLGRFRDIREEIERRLRVWLSAENMLGAADSNPLVEKVRRELTQYEHPLFDFDARPSPAHGSRPPGEEVEVEIRFRPPGVDVDTYHFRLLPREIEHAQFPWTFQKLLYDCLHDYIIEMFIRNPQREN